MPPTAVDPEAPPGQDEEILGDLMAAQKTSRAPPMAVDAGHPWMI